ncbi:MAG: phosphatidylglycerophosphatase [Burkholderia sp.]|nr:phosphatidylglycerophosphatase [Burkholderia sp.]
MTDAPKSATPMLGGRSILQFMCRHPAHLIAQGFGSGLSPVMPGTTGTLFGWASYVALTSAAPAWFSPFHWACLIVAGFVVGVWACGRTGRDMGVADHGSMVWDEIIAFWLVLLFVMPASFSTQLWAFVVFRFFDMVKPPPIRFFDEHVKGGFGVMWDDIVAAFYTLLLIALWRAGVA